MALSGFYKEERKDLGRIVGRLGGVIVEETDYEVSNYLRKIRSNVTHLVLNGPWTYKVLEALSTSRYILTPEWLRKCQEENAFVDETDFEHEDYLKVSEWKDESDLFQGIVFYLDKGLLPSPLLIEDI